ncbi:hypothetical protein Fmac_027687 [Flemingia macrophylla]|uniref:glutathione transferase n=1 Tax=Flemingia macrophylla TaxID=520843 RepID=A0ABD1LIF6_9FABA
MLMATLGVQAVRPPPLTSTSDPPPLFDGTTRLYISYPCPYAQRVWITRNYKGLQDKIKLIAIDLEDRPAWYKEKVYPENKVPSLEHNGKVLGESIDLIKYVDANFEGTPLVPRDPAKQEFGEELISHVDTFNKDVFTSLKGDPVQGASSAFDYLENALGRFDDGPFLLGQFSLVDIAYIPFVERFQIFLSEVFKYDITEGRPKVATWVEEVNKIDAYAQTRLDPQQIVERYKKRYLNCNWFLTDLWATSFSFLLCNLNSEHWCCRLPQRCRIDCCELSFLCNQIWVVFICWSCRIYSLTT